VAVGMNIDIASIDMVSEVNMVSINTHRYVSAMGTVRGLCSHWGLGGVSLNMCIMWGQEEGIWSWNSCYV